MSSPLWEKLRSRLGIYDLPKKTNRIPPDINRETNWDFVRFAQSRRLMGCIRYGSLGALGKPQYDRIADMLRRLVKYNKTGNTEFLVDVGNLAMIEFTEGQHPKRHFNVVDGEHTKHTEVKI